MNYVLLESHQDSYVVQASNRLSLGDTRSRDSLVAFQHAVIVTLTSTAPDKIAIKAKPEKGNMRAGAAALKMEGIVLANAPCPSEFVSGARINKCAAADNSIYAYLQSALKTAAVVLKKEHP